MFGPCKICIEKEQRIAELKEQVSYFKTVLHPEPTMKKYEMETDFVMDGGGREQLATPISQEAQAKIDEQIQAIQEEQDKILSGTY
jgi:hypothetical protein